MDNFAIISRDDLSRRKVADEMKIAADKQAKYESQLKKMGIPVIVGMVSSILTNDEGDSDFVESPGTNKSTSASGESPCALRSQRRPAQDQLLPEDSANAEDARRHRNTPRVRGHVPLQRNPIVDLR